jgi:hypothetical protein
MLPIYCITSARCTFYGAFELSVQFSRVMPSSYFHVNASCESAENLLTRGGLAPFGIKHLLRAGTGISMKFQRGMTDLAPKRGPEHPYPPKGERSPNKVNIFFVCDLFFNFVRPSGIHFSFHRDY